MKFTITCAAFCRLAGIPAFFEPKTDEEIKKQLSCVRLENKSGNVFGIATNQKVAAVEWLGKTTEKDGAVHIALNPDLIKQCTQEAAFDSFLEIIYIPEILQAGAKTMLGFVLQGNAAAVGVPEHSPLAQWRDWIPQKMPTKSKGAMYWNVDHIATLAAAAPTGKIVFPEFIDVDQPLIIRDVDAPEWFGMFIAKPAPSDTVPPPAGVPEWVRL
jgi:hypothetical protein